LRDLVSYLFVFLEEGEAGEGSLAEAAGEGDGDGVVGRHGHRRVGVDHGHFPVGRRHLSQIGGNKHKR